MHLATGISSEVVRDLNLSQKAYYIFPTQQMFTEWVHDASLSILGLVPKILGKNTFSLWIWTWEFRPGALDSSLVTKQSMKMKTGDT